MGSININLYMKINNENILKDTISFNIDNKICELREKILHLFFNEKEYNYVNITNITEKIYKDYGLLFFDKGLLPETLDNYTLNKFTIEDRTFDFLVEPCSKNNKFEVNKIVQNNRSKGIYNPNRRFNPQYEEKTEQKEFVFNEEDFPPLC